MLQSSKKKIFVEIKRKSVRNGKKSKFPTGDAIESGNPHAIKIGKEISVKKSCR